MRHATSGKPVKGYVNQTAEKPEGKWEYTICPSPLFDSAQSKLAMDAAVRDNPRREGEGIIEWLERLNVAAGTMLLRDCSTAQPPREPGQEG